MSDLATRAAVPARRSRADTIVPIAAQLLAFAGFKAVWPFLPMYLSTLGVSSHSLPLWSGLLDFSEDLALAIAAPIWGVFGDRYGRKPMIIRVFLGGSLVVLLIIAAPNALTVLGLMLLSGFLTGVSGPMNALVASITPKDDLSKMMGWLFAAGFLANTIGPLLGGTAVDALGLHGGFAVGAGLLVAAALLIIVFIREPPRSSEATAPDGPATEAKQPKIWSQLGLTLRIPRFPTVLLVLGLLTLAGLILFPVIPVLVPRMHHLPRDGGHQLTATAVGLAMGIPGVSGFLASIRCHALVKRWGIGNTLALMTAVAAVATAVLAFTDDYWVLFAIRFGSGFFMGTAQVAAGILVAETVPEEGYSTAFGVAASVQSLASAFSFLGGGLLGFQFGLHSVFAVSAVLLGVVAVLSFLVLRRSGTHTAGSGTGEETRLTDR